MSAETLEQEEKVNRGKIVLWFCGFSTVAFLIPLSYNAGKQIFENSKAIAASEVKMQEESRALWREIESINSSYARLENLIERSATEQRINAEAMLEKITELAVSDAETKAHVLNLQRADD